MTMWLIAGLALGTFALRYGGVLAGTAVPESARTAVKLLPVAMLAALVAVQTFYGPDGFELDARALGVLGAAVALCLRAPFLVVVTVAAGISALVRLL